MKSASLRVVWTVGLMGVSVAALAAPDTDTKRTPPQEPAGFIVGGIVGGLAAGPVGAVIGAGVGTWLGSRVHRAAEATQAEARITALQAERTSLAAERSALAGEKAALEGERSALQSDVNELSETTRALAARLDQLSPGVDAAETDHDPESRADAATALDGLQGNVLFRTNSAEISPEMAQGIRGLAGAVARSPDLKVRVEGYADARGGVDVNLKLSEARAVAVRDLLLEAGVSAAALEVTAYGKSQSVAADPDGYAFERRVRLTLRAAEPTTAEAAQAAAAQAASAGAAPAAHAAPVAPTAPVAQTRGAAGSLGAGDVRTNENR